MRNSKIVLIPIGILLLLLSSTPSTAESDCKFAIISFDDIKPPETRLTVCWAGIGIDHEQRVYFAASDQREGHPDDTVIFRYHTRTGARELLGTLRGISAAEGNLEDKESIGKIHVSFMEHKNKMYFSSHDYHTIKPDHSDVYDRRGGHFYSFDLKTEQFEDLSKTDNHGVSVPYQGIIAMDILRKHDKLAGFTFPYGDILIYDLKKRQTTFYPGVPEYRRSNVTRDIWATKKGKVYFSYSGQDFWIWELDINTGVMRRTENRNVVSHGFLHGMVKTRDRGTVYLMTNTGGNLYSFDVEEEQLKELGSILPKEEIAQGRTITFVYGLILSHDEKKLYAMPCRFNEGGENKSGEGKRVVNGAKLYEYDIETGVSRLLADFSSELEGTVTGNGVIDEQGRLYFGYHSGSDEGRNARLLQVYREDGGISPPANR